jgi:hypothetical protein
MPSHSNANRSHSSSPTASKVSTHEPPARHPISRPPVISTASSTAELMRSAPARPSGTARLLMGSDRKRLVTPFFESLAIALMVPSSPNIIASANIPGIR